MLNCQNVIPEVLFSIGPVEVRFYGTMIAMSAVVTFFGLNWLVKNKPQLFSRQFTSDNLLDLIFWSLLVGLLGARLFFILFYNLEFYLKEPLQVFAVWQGGLSVHGGIAGGALGLWVFARKQKLSFWELADLLVPFLAMGLGFGRIANFANGELVGRATDFAWGCDFGDQVNRWPVQLIDSAKNFLIMAILFYLLLKKNLPKGSIAALFLLLIGSLRFTTEFIRQPDDQVGFVFSWLTMGQILAILTIIAGAVLLYLRLQEAKK